MIACVDVHYPSTAACVLFSGWSDDEAAAEYTAQLEQVESYEPGQFYKRELPAILAVLALVREPIDTVIVDGYVWLGSARKGLGAYVFDEVDASVIGVAKSRFEGADAVEVLRGESQNPLYVTAAGMDPQVAAQHIRDMHGPFRIPTLLKWVDQLCRGNQ